MYSFGLNLGIAFQLQDDYLDVYGDPKTFGKQVGGDIIENKKTFLYIKAMQSGTEENRKQLQDLYSIQPKETASKVSAVRNIFNESGAAEATREAIASYTQKAFLILDELNLSSEKKKILRTFGNNLMLRTV